MGKVEGEITERRIFGNHLESGIETFVSVEDLGENGEYY